MKVRFTKTAVFLAALIPLGRLCWKALHDGLGANPIEVITHSTGDWTLILILTTLSITPLRRITRQYWLIGVRRMIGLFAFFYGTLHFLTYIWLVKADLHKPIEYGVVLGILLLYRMVIWASEKRNQPAARPISRAQRTGACASPKKTRALPSPVGRRSH